MAAVASKWSSSTVGGEHFVLRAVLENHRGALAAGDVDPPRGAHRRGPDVVDSLDPDLVEDHLSGLRIQAGQDVVEPLEEVELVAVEQHGGHVGSVAIVGPQHGLRGVGELALGPGEGDGLEHVAAEAAGSDRPLRHDEPVTGWC